MHVHLEAQQIQKLDGKNRNQLPFYDRYNVDVVNLEGSEDAVEELVRYCHRAKAWLWQSSRTLSNS